MTNLFDTLKSLYPDAPVPSLETKRVARELGVKVPSSYFHKSLRVDRGLYNLPDIAPNTVPAPAPASAPAPAPALQPNALVADLNVVSTGFTQNLVPAKDPLFVLDWWLPSC